MYVCTSYYNFGVKVVQAQTQGYGKVRKGEGGTVQVELSVLVGKYAFFYCIGISPRPSYRY